MANDGSDNVSVIDGASNTVVATVGVGFESYGVAVSPDGNRIYVANLDGNSVSVIDGASNTVVATVAVGNHPLGAGVNPSTNRIYVVNGDDDTGSVIEDTAPPAPAGTSTPAPPPTAPTPLNLSGGGREVMLPATGVAAEPATQAADAAVPAVTYATVIASGALLLLVGAWYARRRWVP